MFIPRGGTTGPNLILFLSYIFPYEKFFGFQFTSGICSFLTPGIFYCDERMVVDGGGRRSKKKFSEFAHFFSDEVQVLSMCPHFGFCDVMG